MKPTKPTNEKICYDVILKEYMVNPSEYVNIELLVRGLHSNDPSPRHVNCTTFYNGLICQIERLHRIILFRQSNSGGTFTI